MDHSKCLTHHRRALIQSRMMGLLEFAEDIANSVVVKLLENPKKKCSTSQVVIDVVREMFGDNRRQYSTERRFWVPVKDKHFDQAFIESTVDLDRMIEGTDFKLRPIVILYFVYGMDQKEIARIFGVSDALICLRLREIRETLKAKYSHKDYK